LAISGERCFVGRFIKICNYANPLTVHSIPGRRKPEKAGTNYLLAG
jgi:hypothetical protein